MVPAEKNIKKERTRGLTKNRARVAGSGFPQGRVVVNRAGFDYH